MKWIKYLWHTSFMQIRADWLEYLDVRRQCTMLRGLRNAAYDKIINIVNGDALETQEPSCIVQKYYYNIISNRDDVLKNTLWVMSSKCKKFRKNGSGVKCEKSDCPCVAHNHEYVDACENYNLGNQMRRDFWRVKFAQALERKR